MPVSLRRVLSLALFAALVACSGSMGGNATPSAAGQQMQSTDSVGAALDAAPEAAGGRLVFKRLAIRPDAGAPPIIINFVSDGIAQANVPCISCVSGVSTGDDVGLTGPTSYIPNGATWQYAMSFTDVYYKGKCTLAWAITSGAKTIDSFSASFNVTGAGYALYGLNRNRPAYHGGATLTGRVTCGKSKPSLQIPLHFQ